jgi:small-conductance mechanosensitive channel
MEQILQLIRPYLDSVFILAGLILVLLINSWIFKRLKSVTSEGNLARNTIALTFIFAGLLALILSLPIDKALKGQILSFLGIIISAGIALISTAVLGNLIAGVMNNVMKRFRNGDLIRIGEYQGRVTQKSFFHTEIQQEDSNFMTIPNLYIATNPVKLTRKTNTVVSASVSLVYDVSRIGIEQALKKAALETGPGSSRGPCF